MNYYRLIISLVLPQLAGVAGSMPAAESVGGWYSVIEKSPLSPPNWVFGPVWIILYFLMGLSIYFIWNKIDENKKIKNILILFFVHLLFNAVWSPIFFGLKNPGVALVDLIVVWLLAVLLAFKFWGISRISTYLFIPYLLWISFAIYLNFHIWRVWMVF